MLGILYDRRFRHLFGAQVFSLLGTGLATIALALLAYDLAQDNAGIVLGTAFAIKMVAYVGVSPLVGAFAANFPRRTMLVTLDLCRAGMVGLLPFVSEVWQVYVLVFLFQSFSAAFTPTFQAMIPDILKDEKSYTNALSLSRLAYDLESLVSPALSALFLMFISFHWLFLGTVLGFIASAVLIMSITLPVSQDKAYVREEGLSRFTKGFRIYFATPRLRGLLAFSFAVSAAGAMVLVNTVVLVQEKLAGGDPLVALFFGAYGVGSMCVALGLPSLLTYFTDRQSMMAGAVTLVVGLVLALWMSGIGTGLVIWAILGAGASLILTPSGRLLARSAHPGDRTALYAGHFALSHCGWLITYPMAGWVGATFGLPATFMLMAILAAVASLFGMLLWPAEDGKTLTHDHEATIHEHLHVHDEHHQHRHEGWEGPEPHHHSHRHAPIRHRHVFIIDNHHAAWPKAR